MIILNKKDEIYRKLKELAEWADQIEVGVAFITDGGFKIIESFFKEKNVKFITTTNEFITGSNALRLMNNNYSLKIIDNDERDFHSKIINFMNGDKRITMIGSLNITKKAFFEKFESVNIIESNIKEETFKYLWDEVAVEIDDEYINTYESKYLINKRIKAMTFNEFKEKSGFKPRGMQIETLEEILEVRERGSNRALLWAATGTGKTILSAFDVLRHSKKKTLFIVHNRTIIQSAMEDYKNILFDRKIIELFSFNKNEVYDSDVVFSTEKTVRKLIEDDSQFMEQFDYIVFDEAHKIGRETNQEFILKKIIEDDDKFILAMTATPRRTKDKTFVINLFKEVVGRVDTKEAIEKGFIVGFNYYAAEVDVDYDDQGDLSKVDLNLMINKFVEKLNTINTWDGKKIKGLIFTKTIVEADNIADILTDKGYISQSIHSKKNLKTDDITSAIIKLQSDDDPLEFLVTVDKFNEGVDIPKVNTIGMFRFTESSIIYTQQIGRGLRKLETPGKKLNIIDLVGNFNRKDNNVNRIEGLWGGKTRSPKTSLVDTVLKKTYPEVEFNINKIAMDKILKSISGLSYEKYFNEKLSDLHKLYKEDINLLSIENSLGEDLSTILNNKRNTKTVTTSSRSWYLDCLRTAGYDLDFTNVPKLEELLIDLFSWMPLSASTPEEKESILKLLYGEKVELKPKWISYFTGRSYYDNKLTQLVKVDLTKFFTIENKVEVKINLESLSSKTIYFLGTIRDYLKVNVGRNDKLVIDKWYSKAEIGFMAGYTSSVSRGKFPIFSKDEAYDPEVRFLTNTILREDEQRYQNKIISKNEMILCSSDTEDLVQDKIHNFIGKDLFNKKKRTMFKYIGSPQKVTSVEISETWKEDKYRNKIDGVKKYTRFKIVPQTPLTDEDFVYLTHGL